MRKGLLSIVAGALITLLILTRIFETQINTTTPVLQGILLGIVVLIALGAIILSLWDTEVIGKKTNITNKEQT